MKLWARPVAGLTYRLVRSRHMADASEACGGRQKSKVDGSDGG